MRLSPCTKKCSAVTNVSSALTTDSCTAAKLLSPHLAVSVTACGAHSRPEGSVVEERQAGATLPARRPLPRARGQGRRAWAAGCSQAEHLWPAGLSRAHPKPAARSLCYPRRPCPPASPCCWCHPAGRCCWSRLAGRHMPPAQHAAHSSVCSALLLARAGIACCLAAGRGCNSFTATTQPPLLPKLHRRTTRFPGRTSASWAALCYSTCPPLCPLTSLCRQLSAGSIRRGLLVAKAARNTATSCVHREQGRQKMCSKKALAAAAAALLTPRARLCVPPVRSATLPPARPPAALFGAPRTCCARSGAKGTVILLPAWPNSSPRSSSTAAGEVVGAPDQGLWAPGRGVLAFQAARSVGDRACPLTNERLALVPQGLQLPGARHRIVNALQGLHDEDADIDLRPRPRHLGHSPRRHRSAMCGLAGCAGRVFAMAGRGSAGPRMC